MHRWTQLVAGQLASLPALVAGASLPLHAGGRRCWLLAGVALTALAAVLNAGVLLIEIAR